MTAPMNIPRFCENQVYHPGPAIEPEHRVLTIIRDRIEANKENKDAQHHGRTWVALKFKDIVNMLPFHGLLKVQVVMNDLIENNLLIRMSTRNEYSWYALGEEAL